MTATLDKIADEIKAGRCEEARRVLEGTKVTDDNRCELMFLRGYLHEAAFERGAALETYHAVLEIDPDHSEAAFRAALLADQAGDDEEAISLYERCTAKAPAHVNALINLAVLYEDRGDYDRAETCLLEVLDDHPNHWRAQHFLRSVESSFSMMYDEQSQRERERRSAVLDVPISDFELSVRSRNCLRQMNIRTLGDLLKITETELLSYKNFGETSLNEIKAMLAQKGLKLGQTVQPPEPPVFIRPQPSITAGSAHLGKPVSEVEFSVRSRKALQRLGVTTLGELAQKTEAELIAIKNFGQTSLNEVKRQLGVHGLALQQGGG